MKIRYHKNFKKVYKKLPKKIQNKFDEKILIFKDDKNNSILKNHELNGKLKNYFSINVTGDIRAIYKIIDEEIYFFLVIGSHSEIYK